MHKKNSKSMVENLNNTMQVNNIYYKNDSVLKDKYLSPENEKKQMIQTSMEDLKNHPKIKESLIKCDKTISTI